MRLVILLSISLIITTNVHAQEIGLLGSILNDSCEKYIEGTESKDYEYETFCSGYFESIVEHKQFIEKKNIFDCFPTYGDYDSFKTLVIQNFILIFAEQKRKGNDYVRAFDLAQESVDELFAAKCNK